MKRVFYLAAAAVTAAVLLSHTVTAEASVTAGHLDGYDGLRVSGWAWDSDDTAGAANVKIVAVYPDTGEVVAETDATASIPRTDLAAAGYGSGNYGFSAELDLTAAGVETCRIDAYANGIKLPDSLLVADGKVVASARPLRSLGVFTTTAYCSCSRCCGRGGGRVTSSGTVPGVGRTVAVDPSVIPYGTKLMIGGQIYIAEDSGSGVKRNHIDIYLGSHQEAKNYGMRKAEVFLVTD